MATEALTVIQAAEMIGCTKFTVYKWIKMGKLKKIEGDAFHHILVLKKQCEKLQKERARARERRLVNARSKLAALESSR